MAPPPKPEIEAREVRLTELAARKYVESHGCDALSILRERAALAEERGHRVAAATWRDLAEVAARILGSAHSAAALAARGASWRTAMMAALHAQPSVPRRR